MTELIRVSETALSRYFVVSAILGRRLAGASVAAAIAATLEVCRASGRPAKLPSERSCHRWFAAYERGGITALEPRKRARATSSVVLDPALAEFLVRQKQEDPLASIPEILRRARLAGVVDAAEGVSRTTLWREARRRGLPCLRPVHNDDKRRFAYESRLRMVLCDGKHFRAGVTRRKRVALVFLDDASRYGLGVRVATSENTVDFLWLVHDVVSRCGRFRTCYLDHGSAFIANDTAAVFARLGIPLIHGTVRYPEGHGKIERFNRTMKAAVLRGLDGNPAVDDDPRSLTLRIWHWMTEVYNHTPHEGLAGETPYERWHRDPQPLDFPDRDFARHFHSTHERRVSADNIVSIDGVDYETPVGHAGRKVEVAVGLLEGVVRIVHAGRAIVLHPVDPVANARTRRNSKTKETESDKPIGVVTAADLAWHHDSAPITDDDGGYTETERNERNPDESKEDDD